MDSRDTTPSPIGGEKLEVVANSVGIYATNSNNHDPSNSQSSTSEESSSASLITPGRAKNRLASSELIGLRREGSLTMLSKDEDTEEDDKINLNDPTGTRPPSERLKKSRYPKRVPVVDSNLAQAQVPLGPWRRSARPPSPIHPQVRVVWSGEITSAVLSYLTFCRQLLGKGDVDVLEPMEEDEQALEFLQQQGENDIEKAKLLLISSMGAGAEITSVTLDQLGETKSRPRAKGVFRSWVGGDIRTNEIDPSEAASNPSKIKSIWRDWTTRCRKAFQSSQTTVNELLALQRDERQIPRYQSKGSQEDDALVTAANDMSIDLENRLRDLDVYIAEVHDALSVINPGKRLTTLELYV
jgi:hypothetical protein